MMRTPRLCGCHSLACLVAILGQLPAPLAAADPAESRYLMAEPCSILDYAPVGEIVDADYTVVPIALLPSGEDALKQLENLRKTRQAIVENFQKDHVYELSPIGASLLPGELPPSSQTGLGEPPAQQRFLVVRAGAPEPEKTEAEVRLRLQALEVATCHIHVLPHHLAMHDPERYRRDLLIAWERYVELSRIAAPKPSHARLDGLERALSVTETVDGRHVLISVPCQLRVEEST